MVHVSRLLPVQIHCSLRMCDVLRWVFSTASAAVGRSSHRAGQHGRLRCNETLDRDLCPLVDGCTRARTPSALVVPLQRATFGCKAPWLQCAMTPAHGNWTVYRSLLQLLSIFKRAGTPHFAAGGECAAGSLQKSASQCVHNFQLQLLQ